MEIGEDSLGLDCRVVFLRSDGVTPATIDGVPVWTLEESAEGPVGTLTVDPEDPFHATITPLPVPTAVPVAHTAQGSVKGDADLDTDEAREIVALFSVTVRRAEAQSAGVTLTEITPAP